MSLDLCVLASGSSGNCTALRSPAGVVLIDAGIGPRTAAQRLAAAGGRASAGDVVAVCLTHLDRDHLDPNWYATFARRGVRVFCHASRVPDVRARALQRGLGADDIDVRAFDADPFEAAPGLTVYPVALAHDDAGSHGFVVEGFGGRIGYATDLGRVPDELVEHFCDLDVLAIESNYDPQMQVDSARPWFLKQRIMGGRGHLSNAQAFDAVRRVMNRCDARRARPPEHVVLLHRSRQCNCPDVLRALFARDARIAPRLVLAEQDSPTRWLRVTRAKPHTGEQLSLAFG